MVSDGKVNVVVADANVLINFIHIGRLNLLGQLPGLSIVVPEHVVEEISNEAQADELHNAIESGFLAVTKITEFAEIARYSAFTKALGKGESACLALAESRGWMIASDEKRAFRRTAIDCVSEQRLLATPDLIIKTIQARLATVKEADQWKQILEANRFKMKFQSFKELLRQ